MQKKILSYSFMLIYLPLLFASATGIKDLLGKWTSSNETGNIVLIIKSATELIYNGEQLSCEITEGIIRVEDEFFGWVDYPYSLEQDVLTINYPEGYSLQFKKAKEKVSGKEKPSLDKGSTESMDITSHFVGTWKNFTKNTETMVVLYADGTYGYRYTSSYSSAESGEEWGAAADQHAKGTWTVQGTREQGVIRFIDNEGSQSEYQYQVHVENGTVYWSEYYFNGELYGKNIE